MARMRFVSWEVRPVIMIDDGDTLTPVNVEYQTLTASQWEAFKNGGDERALELLKTQIEDPPSPDNTSAAKK